MKKKIPVLGCNCYLKCMGCYYIVGNLRPFPHVLRSCGTFINSMNILFLIHQGESETSSLPTIHIFHLLYNYYKQYYAILHSFIKNSLNKKLHWIRLFVLIMCTSFLMKKAYIGTAYCLIHLFTLKKYMLKLNLKSKLFVFRGMKTMIML